MKKAISSSSSLSASFNYIPEDVEAPNTTPETRYCLKNVKCGAIWRKIKGPNDFWVSFPPFSTAGPAVTQGKGTGGDTVGDRSRPLPAGSHHVKVLGISAIPKAVSCRLCL